MDNQTEGRDKYDHGDGDDDDDDEEEEEEEEEDDADGDFSWKWRSKDLKFLLKKQKNEKMIVFLQENEQR
mgnify:CR=1 FL=1